MNRTITMGIAGILLLSMSCSSSGEGSWETDFEKAKKEAGKRNVPILANFSGSDWCGWCIKLDREVFSKKAFQKFAKDNVVLVIADFPRRTELSEALVKQNRGLAEKYGVRGFPTVLLLDKDGKVVARTGYRPGGAEDYVKHLKKILKTDKS